MRELARRIPLKTKAKKAPQPSYDPYSSYGLDDSPGWIVPLPVKVVSVLDLTEDVHWSGIQRGMRVLDLGCGVGDVSLWIAKLVGPTGLVVGVDESAEDIDVAQKRATVAGQCYWARFVTADLNNFISNERYDVVVVRLALVRQGERATFLRLSTWLRTDGLIIITGNPAGTTDNRFSVTGGKGCRRPLSPLISHLNSQGGILMRVAIFSNHKYDQNSFEQANGSFKHELVFVAATQESATASLASGFSAVCAFVNDRLDALVLAQLANGGTKFVALRCAGAWVAVEPTEANGRCRVETGS